MSVDKLSKQPIIEDVSEIVTRHEVSYHLFADDIQLHTAIFPDELHVSCQRLTSCISDL